MGNQLTFERLEIGTLRRFEVNGFRNFGKGAGINLKGLNIAVGPNGAGKSTLLGLFRLFDKVFRSGNLHHIGIEDLDEYDLLTPNQKPFTIRLHFDEFVFAYEYSITKNMAWELNHSSCYLPTNLNKPMIRIGHQLDFFMNTRMLTNWLISSCNLTDIPQKYQQTKRQHLSIASKFFECITSFDVKHQSKSRHQAPSKPFPSGAVVHYEGGWLNLCPSRTHVNYTHEDFGRSQQSGTRFVQAINSLTNDGWRESPLFPQDFELRTEECAEHQKEQYDTFQQQRLSVFQRSEGWSSNGFRQGPIANLITTWAVAYVEGRLTGKEQQALQDYYSSALQDEPHVVSFFDDLKSIIKHTQIMVLALMKGGVGLNRKFGMLAPKYLGHQGTLNERQRAHARRHSEFISIAEMQSISEALTENKPLRREILKHLEDHSRIQLALPSFNLNCTLFLSKKGMIVCAAEKEGKRIELESLSRGEKKLLLIALSKEFFAFLEEPETNLHPSYQSKLGELIAESYVSELLASAHEESNWWSLKNPDEQIWHTPEELTQEEKLPKLATWVARAQEQFLFIETHSEILLKAIQLQMARKMPKKKLWEENPSLSPSFESFEQEFVNPDPNIEVTYFGISNGKWVPKSMGLRRDGLFRETFGPGFYDQSLVLVRSIFNAQSMT